MDSTKLAAMISLIIALSVASERLVEIVKGLFPILNGKSAVAWKEGIRRSVIQLLAVGSGIVTAVLARPGLPQDALPITGDAGIVALGLLASGGSGFWNSLLTYVLKLKDVKEVEAIKARETAMLPTPKE